MQPPIPVDEKLARGLTMAEVRAILRGGREAGASSVRDEAHPVRAAFKPVAFRYATGRRPDAGFVQRLVEKVDAFYGAAPATVFRQAETPPPTEGIPGHTRRYLMLVPTSSDERCRSLLASCVCFDIRRACVMLTQMPLCEIDLHAIERFHLRTRSGLVRDALASFGSALLRDIGLYRTMASYSEKTASKAFAMPFADGLLLGHACPPHPGAVPPHVTVNFFGDETIKFDKLPLEGNESCRVATFIGPDQMRPGQRALRDGILDIASRRAGHLRDHAEVMTYMPGFLDRNHEAGDGYEMQFDRQAREVERDLRTLLDAPGMREALGTPVVRAAQPGDAAGPRYRIRNRPAPAGLAPR